MDVLVPWHMTAASEAAQDMSRRACAASARNQPCTVRDYRKTERADLPALWRHQCSDAPTLRHALVLTASLPFAPLGYGARGRRPVERATPGCAAPC
jgi:hypothetical protein